MKNGEAKKPLQTFEGVYNMMHIKAPNRNFGFVPDHYKKIFLAGSIEMGKAEPWQERLAEEFRNEDAVFFNPRRDDWDSSWTQDPTPGTKFHEQVSWELEKIKESDVIIFYFDPNTQSPITLLELGHCLGSKRSIIVCCPDGYFRKGNVVITCALNNVPVLNSFEELVISMKIMFTRY